MQIQPAIFETHEIRRVYDETTETWWFSVVDIIQILTQSSDYQTARKYWKVLKGRLAKEGSQLVTNCYQLKMTAEDGKQRLTDVATAETLLPWNENLDAHDRVHLATLHSDSNLILDTHLI